MSSSFFHLTEWPNFNRTDYWIEFFDIFLFFTLLILIVCLIGVCCKILCSLSSKKSQPIVSEITEVVATPISFNPYEHTYNSCRSIKTQYNGINQQLAMDNPVSPSLTDVSNSGNNYVNIFLKVGSKDKIEENLNEGQFGKIEELTRSSTLKTLSSQINKKETKKSNRQKEDVKSYPPKKSAEIKKNEINSSFKDPSTVGYTSSGEPLSSVSSKYTTNHQ